MARSMDSGVLEGEGGAPSLGISVGWGLFGQLVFAAAKGGFLVVLAKLASPTELGSFALAVAVTAPIVMFTSMDLRNVLAGDVAGDHRLGDYLGLRTATAFATVLLAGLVAFVGPFEASMVVLLVLLGLARGLWALTDILQGYLQKHERMDLVAASNVSRGVLGLGGLTAGLVVMGGAIGAALGLTLGWGLSLVLVDLPLSTRRFARSSGNPGDLRPSRDAMTALAGTAAPLAPVAVLLMAPNYIPQYFVEGALGREALGIFAALAGLIFAGFAATRGIGEAVLPRMAQSFETGDGAMFGRVTLGASSLAGGLGLAGAATSHFAGEPILTLLFTSTYADHHTLLTWLFLAGALLYAAMILDFAITSTRYFRPKPWILGAGTVVLIVTSARWIPAWGLTGAAWAMAATGASLLVMQMTFLAHVFPSAQAGEEPSPPSGTSLLPVPIYRATKRTTDAIFAGLGLLVATPLLLAIALSIRVRMGSPVLFRQERAGKDGEPFTLVKFRTMTEERDDEGRLLPDEDRLTSLGAFLRKTSLDELPSLWNVLKGEMSFVGPRPLLIRYLDRYDDEQRRRHEVKPGLTGPVIVEGRNRLSWEEKFELDVWYVDNRSFGLDLRLLARTVSAIIEGDGVSQPGEATVEFFKQDEGSEPPEQEHTEASR